MKFAENSRFCFCVEFDLTDYDEFNEIIRKEYKKIHIDYEIPDDLTKSINLRNNDFIAPVFYSFNIESRSSEDIMSVDEKQDEIIKEYKEEQKKYFEIPKAHLRIDFNIKKPISEDDLLRIFENYPEKSLIKRIENIINKDFNIITCVYANFNKKTEVLQGIKLRKLLEFPRGINEKVGNPYIRLIGFDVKDSPLGVEELEFGEEEDKKIFNMKMKFKNKKMSNLKEIFRTLNDTIKLFVLEE